MKTRTKNILRWLALLPASILSGAIAFLLLYLIGNALGSPYGEGVESIVYTMFTNLVVYFAISSIATTIAPKEIDYAMKIIRKGALIMNGIQLVCILYDSGTLNIALITSGCIALFWIVFFIVCEISEETRKNWHEWKK